MFAFFKRNRLYGYLLFTLVVSVSAAIVYAASVPNTFTAGTTALSSEVNENFDYLSDRSWELSGSDLSVETTVNISGINTTYKHLIVKSSTGNVGIGTTSLQGKLDVNGTIFQRGASLHADYVFESAYKLESIREHADFMWENKHLKAIRKATVDEEDREIIEVGAHRKGIVEELEKAHIYIDQLHMRIKVMEERLDKTFL